MDKIERIILYLRLCLSRLELHHYRCKIPKLVKRIRAKEKIQVWFMLSDLSMWKTEELYKTMVDHPRFEPHIGTVLLTGDAASASTKKYKKLKDYLNYKHYQYKDVYIQNTSTIKADIIFYQQPYLGVIAPEVFFQNFINGNTLFCYANYALYSVSCIKENKFCIDSPLHRFSWQIYMENALTAEVGKLSVIKGKNIVITGLPVQDTLLKDTDNGNPWKPQTIHKKKIIFAPHHTIPTTDNLLNYSQFLEVADMMLVIAEKYKDKVQFAFKPHPFLYTKLKDFWGEEKTAEYYKRWEDMENTQLVDGAYQSLFKYSDALIHDCSSFTIEYCFTKKPAMYLVKPEQEVEHRTKLNRFAQKAFDLHKHGVTKEDIEEFILSVIDGDDAMKSEREKYYNDYLLPPNGKTASENIINAILGQGEYK